MSEIVLSFGSYSNSVVSDYFCLQALHDESIHFMTSYEKKHPRVLICDYVDCIPQKSNSVDINKLKETTDWDGTSHVFDMTLPSQPVGRDWIRQSAPLHDKSTVEIAIFSSNCAAFAHYANGKADLLFLVSHLYI